MFLVFGLSGIIPAVHYTVREGLEVALSRAALGPLALMGSLYVLGAVFYAVRVPERWFPGKCDLWVSISPIHLITGGRVVSVLDCSASLCSCTL